MRSLLGRSDGLRPPWSTEARIRSACTSCGDCIRACPEAILIRGPAGTPIVDFSVGACTFCQDCAVSCPEPVFDLTRAPWALSANLTPECLMNGGIECRSCTDACDTRALRFDLTQRPIGAIRVDADACTGCGACISVCPADAITLSDHEPRLEAAS